MNRTFNFYCEDRKQFLTATKVIQDLCDEYPYKKRFLFELDGVKDLNTFPANFTAVFRIAGSYSKELTDEFMIEVDRRVSYKG